MTRCETAEMLLGTLAVLVVSGITTWMFITYNSEWHKVNVAVDRAELKLIQTNETLLDYGDMSNYELILLGIDLRKDVLSLTKDKRSNVQVEEAFESLVDYIAWLEYSGKCVNEKIGYHLGCSGSHNNRSLLLHMIYYGYEPAFK